MSSSLKLRTLRQQQELSEEMKAVRLPTMKERLTLTIVSLWFFCGLFTDGWAHSRVPELETFFTPWHALFYSGYAATALVLIIIVWRNSKRLGLSFRKSIPLGYEGALFGIPLFIAASVGDLLWHELFGIDVDREELLSPTHLVLAVSMFLMLSANLRVWFKETPPLGRPKFFQQLPMLLSLMMSISIVWFMLQFSHFITSRAGGLIPSPSQLADLSQSIAITGYLLHSTVFLGFLFLILQRGRLATGAISFVFISSMVAMAVIRDGIIFLPITIFTGIVADILASRLHPLEQHRKEFRSYAFLLPSIFFTGYFLTIYLHDGLWWSVHLWTGSIVMAGLIGLLLSFIAVTPSEDPLG